MTRILVGTDDGIHDLASDHVFLRGHAVNALVAGEGDWWALQDGIAILSGALDPEPSHAVAVDGLRANCLLPSARGLLVGTSEACLLRLRNGGVERVGGFDKVEGRDGWYTPWGGPPDTRSMSEGPDGTLYVNVHVGGIPVSTDGERFRPTIDVDADVHQVLAHPARPGSALAATARGLATTTNGGSTWRLEDHGLHAGYCRAVALAGEARLLSVSRGPRGRHAAVYRSPMIRGWTMNEPSEPFEKCERGLPEWFDRNIDTHCLAATGSTAAFGTEDGRVNVSKDAGLTWEEAASGLAPVRCVAIEE